MNNNLLEIKKGQVLTSSLLVAEQFGKRHGNVLRDIRNLILKGDGRSFLAENFTLSHYTSKRNKICPMYFMTMPGLNLLVLSFTGRGNVSLQLQYIKTFHQLREGGLR